MIVVYIKCCDEKNIVLSFLQNDEIPFLRAEDGRAVSPDGARLAVLFDGGAELRILHVAVQGFRDGRCFLTVYFILHFFHVSCLVPLTFSRMSSILVTSAGGDDNAVQTEGTAKAAEHVAGRFEQSCECVASDDREP